MSLDFRTGKIEKIMADKSLIFNEKICDIKLQYVICMFHFELWGLLFNSEIVASPLHM